MNFSDPFGLCPPETEWHIGCGEEPGAINESANTFFTLYGAAGALRGLVSAGVRALVGAFAEKEAAGAADVALASRAGAIQGALPEATQGYTTTAVANVTQADGSTSVLVASSETALRPAQRAALAAGEVAVTGSGHAEMTILNAARKMGATVDAIAVSRPICAACAQALKQAGVDILTVLKQ